MGNLCSNTEPIEQSAAILNDEDLHTETDLIDPPEKRDHQPIQDVDSENEEDKEEKKDVSDEVDDDIYVAKTTDSLAPTMSSPHLLRSATGSERYSLNKVITKTQEGKLYRARDLVTDTTVGVKEAHKVLMRRSSTGEKFEQQEFSAELHLQETIKKYRDVPSSIRRMLDVWETPSSQYAVLEWADGLEMFDFVTTALSRQIETVENEEQVPTPSDAMSAYQTIVQSIFQQLVAGVAWLHAKGFVHRDLSMENMIMGDRENRTVKIIDFGMSTHFEKGGFQCRPGRIGQIQYMAPEVYARHFYDGRAADIWSLGIVLFMMLVGCAPYNTPHANDNGFSMLTQGQIPKMLKHWGRLPLVTPDALDLMSKIFQPEGRRILMKGIWAHSFVKMSTQFPS